MHKVIADKLISANWTTSQRIMKIIKKIYILSNILSKLEHSVALFFILRPILLAELIALLLLEILENLSLTTGERND